VNGARRLLLSGAALTALLALVALASRAHRPGGGTGGGGGHLPPLLLEYAGVVALCVIVIGGALVVWGVADDRRRRTLAGKTNWKRTLSGIFAVMFAVLVGLAVTRHLRQNTNPRPQGASGAGAPLRATAAERARLRREAAARRTQAEWPTVVILASVLLGLALAAGFAARYRRLHGDEQDAEAALALALAEVLADTLQDLREEGDPRKAVIGAYGRMERTFAAYRVPRDPAETPLEYVARVLGTLNVSAHAVRRLTLLFERAKFSTHAVGSDMKEEAIATLVGLRAELEAGDAEEAA
jgi:Domain of unknown function (DUF4129)